jgi:hypothetical protein
MVVEQMWVVQCQPVEFGDGDYHRKVTGGEKLSFLRSQPALARLHPAPRTGPVSAGNGELPIMPTRSCGCWPWLDAGVG